MKFLIAVSRILWHSLADLLALAGGIAVIRGVALLSTPAAWILSGIFLVVVAHAVAHAERAHEGRP